ncbi:methyl-accepting chemotaxis protein [Glaciecola sp. 1036]|uniref:methyl-accepting chemotaxis protein n=1 Tax=Alteromonadaceae TaxID=72275 RepID=UPI003D015BF1
MQTLQYTSTILIVVNEKDCISELSKGALKIGLKEGNPWPYGYSNTCQINNADFLMTVDPCESGHIIHLQDLKAQFTFHKALESISQCNLVNLPQMSGKLGGALLKAVSTLNESIKQALEASCELERGSNELNHSSTKLSDRTVQVTSQLEQTLSTSEELHASIRDNLSAAESLTSTASAIDSDVNKVKQSVGQARSQMEDISTRVLDTEKIVEAIDEIAFKTNILSLNAAVEAARAGEAGRGFSIVAQEVGMLAKHSASQAGEIRTLLKNAQASSLQGQKTIESVDSSLENLFLSLAEVSRQIEEINRVSENQSVAMSDTSTALNGIADINQKNAVLADSLSNLATRFNTQTQFMRDSMEVFKIQTDFSHPKHREAFNLTKQTAEKIGRAFELAIQQGRISKQALFERNHHPIANTNPVKYSTAFDKFCDSLLPSIQEPALASKDFVAYIIATDNHGYVPTHNNQFCQALTGDAKKDLAGNRTKRIFSDRVGQSSANHRKDYLLLTYRRDTGEILTDLSCPIFVNGEHWGAVRCGYKL